MTRTAHALAILTMALLTGAALAQGVDAGSVFREDILPSILAALVSVATATIAWAATRASAWFEARAKESKGTLMQNAVGLAYMLAGTTVQHLAQSVVDKLRAASADGKLDPRDAADVLKAAVLEVWNGLGTDIRDLLLQQYGSFDQVRANLLEPAVEAKVREAKITTPLAEPPIQNEAQALRELQLARERLRTIAGA